MTIVGVVTLFGGVLILVGAVAMTKFQRLYDAAIYRTLGASTRMVTAMVAVEYGCSACSPGRSEPPAHSASRGCWRGTSSRSTGARRRSFSRQA